MTDGVEALFIPKGRRQKQMKNLKVVKSKKTLTHGQQLEEITLLRIENEYLKKCHIHGITSWSQRIKSKQE